MDGETEGETDTLSDGDVEGLTLGLSLELGLMEGETLRETLTDTEELGSSAKTSPIHSLLSNPTLSMKSSTGSDSPPGFPPTFTPRILFVANEPVNVPSAVIGEELSTLFG